MKSSFLLLSLSVIVASCGGGAKLLNTATYSRANAPFFVTPVQADLEVSPEKIHHHMEVTDVIRAGGEENIVATAVQEAIDVYGGDVIIGLEKQLKYNESGQIESITISGYTAKYVNFRPCESIPAVFPTQETGDQKGSGIFGIKK